MMTDLETKAKECFLGASQLHDRAFMWDQLHEYTKDYYRGQVATKDLIFRLRKRAEIRRSIPRGEPDRISDLLEEAANALEGTTS
jgi:hypothetical protein